MRLVGRTRQAYIRAMQTALHIQALVAEMKRELIGGTVAGTEYYRKERAAYLFIKSHSGLWAVGAIFHPAGPGYFVVPASKIKLETREKPWPFFDIIGAEILAISQPVLDRICYITIKKGDKRFIMALEAIGPNGNIWFLDEHFGRLATLRNREFTPGDVYQMPPLPDRLIPSELNADVLKRAMVEQVATMPHLPLITYLEKAVIGFNRTLARELATRAEVASQAMEDLDAAGLARLVDAVHDILSRFVNPDAGYLYVISGTPEAYPFKLSSIDTQPEKFKSLSLAVMSGAGQRQERTEEVDERRSTRDLVRKAIHRLERRIEKLQADITEAADFEKYKQLGELLHINFNKLKRGMTSVTVPDIYSDTHSPVTIALEQALSAKDNVELYFKRYRKGREGLELLQRRLEITRQELATLQMIQAELEASFESAVERYKAELASLQPRERSTPGTAAEARLPYRPYALSTGLTIYVGRDGSDNDRTTFEFAKPYELWFHAQQCPGSHVVIKYPNKSFEPSKAEIEETAAVAAWFSKAKNDSLVPVIYTERRYVRKPAKAKPGLVTVEREKSIMVAPKKPDERST